MKKIHRSILETVGNTPVVKINNLGPRHVNLYVKLESFNPMGSVKDRLALGVIEDAERKGELKPGQTIVEATSGNTGIGLAMVCAQKGYPLVITMAENFSVERRKLMRFLGAKVILTPADKMGSGMVDKAQELAEKHGWWQSKQFQNPANAEIHAKTTAVEILDSFSEIGLDFFVTGAGTGGTLNGVSSVLKQQSPKTRVIVCEPDNSQMIKSGIPQARNPDGSHQKSHPGFQPHMMQGWTPDFIPKLTEEVLHEDRIDGHAAINGNAAMQCARELAQKEGVFVGISAGATFSGALQIAENAPEGSNILCMMPDTGERYLSTPLFDNISADMSEEEVSLSQSTDNFRFDSVEEETEESSDSFPAVMDEVAKDKVNHFIRGSQTKVVMFALEWCEFCWSVRKILEKFGVECQSVDLDSVIYSENQMGQKMRQVLETENNWKTVPQIYIGKKFIGGCTDLFDLCINGELQKLFAENQIDYNASIELNPYDLLPAWLHPR